VQPGQDGWLRNRNYFNNIFEYLCRPPMLKGTHPPMWSTPGRLQYYKAEMEPYLPGNI